MQQTQEERPCFKYDPKKHRYTLDGVILPSVTQIINPLYDFSAVKPDLLQRAGVYGTAVHEMIKIWLEGELDEEALDPGLKGPLEAFSSWWGIEDRGAVTVELPTYHPKLKYSGTGDLVFDDNLLVDVKTRNPSKVTDILQLEAYAHLYYDRPEKVDKAILYLAQDGSYQFTLMADKQAWSFFRYLLDDWDHKKEFEAKIKGWREKK